MTKVKFRSDNEVSLEDFMGGDDRACMSAWVSFGNDDEARLKDRKKVGGLLNFLYSNKHMTPFESTAFTFRIKTPIFVAREFFRHRSASYNEWSGRYSHMLPEFYIPSPDRPLIQNGKPGDYYFVPGTEEQYAIVKANQEHLCAMAWKVYEDTLAAGVAKEVARNILPLNTYTYFYVTMNARNLMHFLGLRNESHALYEIRDVARQMEEIFAEKMPLTYATYRRVRDAQENTIAVDMSDQVKARKQVVEILNRLNLQGYEDLGYAIEFNYEAAARPVAYDAKEFDEALKKAKFVELDVQINNDTQTFARKIAEGVESANEMRKNRDLPPS